MMDTILVSHRRWRKLHPFPPPRGGTGGIVPHPSEITRCRFVAKSFLLTTAIVRLHSFFFFMEERRKKRPSKEYGHCAVPFK